MIFIPSFLFKKTSVGACVDTNLCAKFGPNWGRNHSKVGRMRTKEPQPQNDPIRKLNHFLLRITRLEPIPVYLITLPKFNTSSLKSYLPHTKVVFQLALFRGKLLNFGGGYPVISEKTLKTIHFPSQPQPGTKSGQENQVGKRKGQLFWWVKKCRMLRNLALRKIFLEAWVCSG